MTTKYASSLALDALWDSAPSSKRRFDPACLLPRAIPERARRYLQHAIAPGTLLASAVRLRMHGEFRLNKKWLPFTAEQVIRTDGEMLWRAKMRLYGLPIRGFDRVLHGEGEMQWKLLGLFPVANACGPDITRSALGRVMGESVWLPSLLCGADVLWTTTEPSQAYAHVKIRGEATKISLGVADTGRLQSIQYPRWGAPDGGEFAYVPFGGVAEEERAFGGYTIPTRLRVGWHFGEPSFDDEGEFFRVTIDDAIFR